MILYVYVQSASATSIPNSRLGELTASIPQSNYKKVQFIIVSCNETKKKKENEKQKLSYL